MRRVVIIGTATRRRTVIVALAWASAAIGAAALLAVGLADSPVVGSPLWRVAFAALSIDCLVYATVGAVLAIRRPGNLVGPLVLVAGIMIAGTFLGFVGGALLTYARGPDDLLAAMVALSGGLQINATLVVAGPAIAFVFPDGRLPGPRWRLPVAVLAVALVIAATPNVLRPGSMGEGMPLNPFSFLSGPIVDVALTAGDLASALAVPGALVLALTAVIIRFRRAQAVEREQLKWFVAANILVVGSVMVAFVEGPTGITVFDILAIASLSLPALAIGVAILRYRLYEIDRLISRTVSWALITGVLVAVFATGVVGLQALLDDVTQGQTLAVAASTLVAFGLFQPVRRRVQHAVDRRFDRARYDGERTAAAFADRLRDQVDLGELEQDLQRVADESVRPASVDVWLRSPAEARE